MYQCDNRRGYSEILLHWYCVILANSIHEQVER